MRLERLGPIGDRWPWGQLTVRDSSGRRKSGAVFELGTEGFRVLGEEQYQNTRPKSDCISKCTLYKTTDNNTCVHCVQCTVYSTLYLCVDCSSSPRHLSEHWSCSNSHTQSLLRIH